MSKITLGETPLSSLLEESYLAHYGVKGMHWGIRKDPQQRSISDMTDAELRDTVNRMRLEQQYREITESKATKVGRKHVARYTNQAVNLVVSTVLTATIGAYVKSRFDSKNPPTLPHISWPRRNNVAPSPPPLPHPFNIR